MDFNETWWEDGECDNKKNVMKGMWWKKNVYNFGGDLITEDDVEILI